MDWQITFVKAVFGEKITLYRLFFLKIKVGCDRGKNAFPENATYSNH